MSELSTVSADQQLHYRRIDEAGIRSAIGTPIEKVKQKIEGAIGPLERRYIAHCPFIAMSTSDGSGQADCSPRGDQPGFVRVLNDRTLAIPDRWGNKLADSMRNLMSNPGIGLLFLIPGLNETLRINGTAYVTDDLNLRLGSREGEKTPDLMIVVDIEEVYLHCGKALIRSKLWTDREGELADAVCLGRHVEALQLVAKGSGDDLEQVAADIDAVYKNELY
jgi:PPOX class probable FMN-dependent enzyme